MKRAVLVVLAACRAGGMAGGGDDYPPVTGGAGPIVVGAGASSDGDAGTGDAGLARHGRVCLLADLSRVGDLTACDPGKAGGLVVSLGTRTATTTSDGSFAIVPPLGGGLTWHVTGDKLVTSVMPFGADDTIPAILDVVYTELLSTNLVTLSDQQGSIIVRVVSSLAPVVGATAMSVPASSRLALYDASSAMLWKESGGTGPRGVVWFADVPLAASGSTFATIALSPPGRRPVPAVPVENQAITFLSYDVQ